MHQKTKKSVKLKPVMVVHTQFFCNMRLIISYNTVVEIKAMMNVKNKMGNITLIILKYGYLDFAVS